MSGNPIIAIATGNPARIGPEISLKVALDPAMHAACEPILVGDPGVNRISRQSLRYDYRHMHVMAHVADAD